MSKKALTVEALEGKAYSHTHNSQQHNLANTAKYLNCLWWKFKHLNSLT